LQTSDEFNVITLADWKPGEDTIVSPAGSRGVAKNIMAGKEKVVECKEWFFCTKKISKKEIEDKLIK
jgi:peroxiredoxin (alkyl hydroperoxide reductase subunit C)